MTCTNNEIETSAMSPRVAYGLSRLRAALAACGHLGDPLVGLQSDQAFVRRWSASFGSSVDTELKAEGFNIQVADGQAPGVMGADDSGVMYGALELAKRIRAKGRIGAAWSMTDAPSMALRGSVIGMQKTFILPGARVYEYPYTPELFPFFYDEAFWNDYLDRLVELRMNSLYLWNGHPFSSLVRVPGYEYAVEVSDEIFARNVHMFRHIAQECDRRGIWLLQKFYSIILPRPFADRHGVATQLNTPTPVVSDYMRRAIGAFISEYPSVGLLVCLGEALSGLENQTFWLRDVILAGVRDGMGKAGMTHEPPVVVRAHATDPTVVLPPALRTYRNLYTMAKYNGESLTTTEPRGVRQKVHQAMARMGQRHVVNVHILANLEPFRYNAQRFIKQSVKAARERLGANGLHLYPLAFWSWPDSPDEADPPLRQIERDWMWYEAWARYAWSTDVDDVADRAYWEGRISERYGLSTGSGDVLDACNDAGECAPRILRRFGITEGNRQTMSLGMTLDQLVEPERFRPYPELWESQSPPGERLGEFVERETRGEPHQGETPPQIVEEILAFSTRAVSAIDRAAPHVTRQKDDFHRLANDIHCIGAMSRFYAAKARAAMDVLRYRADGKLQHMIEAQSHLAQSVEHFRTLTRLTTGMYRFANTMQTAQRRIPAPGGVDGRPINYHWSQLLPLYESELRDFSARVIGLRQGVLDESDESAIEPFPPASVRVLSDHAQTYTMAKNARPYTDRPYLVQSLAAELEGLTGIRFAHGPAKDHGVTPIDLELDEPVQLLVGYFRDRRPIWLQVPDLETDADAVDLLDAEPLILNAATIDSLPAVNVHVMRLGAGRQTLRLKGTGSFVIFGAVSASARLHRRDAKRGGDV